MASWEHSEINQPGRGIGPTQGWDTMKHDWPVLLTADADLIAIKAWLRDRIADDDDYSIATHNGVRSVTFDLLEDAVLFKLTHCDVARMAA